MRAYLVPANFELGCVPSRVLVSRALDVSPRRLVSCHVAVNVERQLDLGAADYGKYEQRP